MVAHQRIGVLAVDSHPSPPQDQKIEIAIVVEVGVDQLQTTGEAGEADCLGALAESAIALVAKIAELVV